MIGAIVAKATETASPIGPMRLPLPRAHLVAFQPPTSDAIVEREITAYWAITPLGWICHFFVLAWTLARIAATASPIKGSLLRLRMLLIACITVL